MMRSTGPANGAQADLGHLTGALDDAPSESQSVTKVAGLHRNIGNVAAASAIALVFGELLTLGQTVALARLLSPAEVGFFVAGTVLTALLSKFVEGGLRSGLVHRENKLDDAANTVFWVTMISGLLMTLLTLAAAPIVGLVFHSRQVGLIAAVSSVWCSSIRSPTRPKRS